MNVSIKNLALGSVMALASGTTLMSCYNNPPKDYNGEMQFRKELNAKQKVTQEIPQNNVKFDSIDVTKPNLPKINDDTFVYKTIDGKTQKVEVRGFYANAFCKSLANSINKYSTKDSPDIKNSDDFLVEMYSQIPKDDNSPSAFKHTSNNLTIANLTNSFNKLYDMYTAPDSEKGKTITVQEYTQMMKAYVGIENK